MGAEQEGNEAETTSPALRHPKLRRRSAGQLAVAYIRQLIFNGELRPGDRIPQTQIARELGLSHIPVREAIAALENEGRVTVERNRGAFVAGFSEQSFKTREDMIGLLWTFVIERAAENASPEVVRHLHAAQLTIQSTDDPLVMRDLHDEWFGEIFECGVGRDLAYFLNGLGDMVVVDNFYAVVPGASTLFKEGTAEITKAIAQHDPQSAARAYQALGSAMAERVRTFEKELPNTSRGRRFDRLGIPPIG